MSGKLTLHTGKSFGKILWGQVQSYCGQLTPQFYTKERGKHILVTGTNDRDFHPWSSSMIMPHLISVASSNLPGNFEELRKRLDRIEVVSAEGVCFRALPKQTDQALGQIYVGGKVVHEEVILTLGIGIPILQELVNKGSITNTEALAVLKSMIDQGITEDFSDELYRVAQMRSLEAGQRAYHRHEFETYLTEVSIKGTSAFPDRVVVNINL